MKTKHFFIVIAYMIFVVEFGCDKVDETTFVSENNKVLPIATAELSSRVLKSYSFTRPVLTEGDLNTRIHAIVTAMKPSDSLQLPSMEFKEATDQAVFQSSARDWESRMIAERNKKTIVQ